MERIFRPGEVPRLEPAYHQGKWRAKAEGQLDIYMELPGGKAMGFKTKLLTVEPNRELRWQGVFLHKILFSGQHYFMIEPQREDQVIFVHGENFGGIMLPFMGSMLVRVAQGFDDMNQALKAKVESVN